MLWQIRVQLAKECAMFHDTNSYVKYIYTFFLLFSSFFNLNVLCFYCTWIRSVTDASVILLKKENIQPHRLYLLGSSHTLCTIFTVMLNHVMKHGSLYNGASATSRYSGLTEYHTDTQVCLLRNLELCNLH